MCGIIGYLGNERASPLLLNGLKRLEYRGYDSAGLVTLKDNKFELKKGVGEIEKLNKDLDFSEMRGNTGIGHTRWATHGVVNEKNAHPHISSSKELALVHNGIIENFEEIKASLKNYKFVSDTDSEVILHFIEQELRNGKNMKESLQKLFKIAKGTFAILILNKNDGKIWAAKRDSPLAIGISNSGFFLGSDIYAFSAYTNKAIFFEDNEFAEITPNKCSFFNKKGQEIDKKISEFEWTNNKEETGKYNHYMIKEISEEPKCIERLLNSLNSDQKEKLGKISNLIKKAGKIVFVAAGSSYHASLYGAYLLNQIGFDARAVIASEFKNYGKINKDTLVISVSQSGETMDVLDAIKLSKNSCLSLVSIVNVPHSTIERSCDLNLNMLAGQEICVASTKTYINELTIFLKLSELLGLKITAEKVSEKLKKIIEENTKEIRILAEKLKDSKDIYLLGKGPGYAVAREIALKLKEISYIHAEGLMGGELKHGTLALIEENTPVITLISEKNDPIISNLKEVESRGALSIKISPFYGDFKIPEEKELFPIYATTIGFLLTYNIAKLKKLPIDKPRNLAKSVTVR